MRRFTFESADDYHRIGDHIIQTLNTFISDTDPSPRFTVDIFQDSFPESASARKTFGNILSGIIRNKYGALLQADSGVKLGKTRGTLISKIQPGAPSIYL